MSKRKKEIISAIELGTRHVKVLIAEIVDHNSLNIIGFGESPSHRVSKGEVTDSKIIFEQLGLAVSQAETMSGTALENVYLTLSGGHVKMLNRQTHLPINRGTVADDDIVSVTRLSRGVQIPAECELIHTMERFYKLDDERHVQNPIGMAANKLSVDTHIIYGNSNSIYTSLSLVEDFLSVPTRGFVFSGIASAYALMSHDDHEKGALCIDIGAGTTEYTLYQGNGAQHSGVFTVGTNQICNDLSLGLKLEYGRCHKLLHDYGNALSQRDGRARILTIPGLKNQSDRNIPRSTLEQIIEMRLSELFNLILNDLAHQGVTQHIGNGIIISGRGSRIPQIAQLAKQIFNTPARCGTILDVDGSDEVISDPGFVTSAGALKVGLTYYTMDKLARKTTMQELKDSIRQTLTNIKTAIRW